MWVPWVSAAPARRATATKTVSASSCSVAPAVFAASRCTSRQYGHCVVRATASAISSLYLRGIAPSASAALSRASKAPIASGVRPFKAESFCRLPESYIALDMGVILPGWPVS
jgi:hypothetical protein